MTEAVGSRTAGSGAMNLVGRLRPWRYLLLALVALAFFLPGQSRLPPVDRDESRFAEATAQMLQTRNFIDVRFQDAPRYLQPVGIYWLQAVSTSLLSSPQARQIWSYRVPSLLSAIGAVLLTAFVGETLFGVEAGFLAGALLAMSMLLGFEARMAKIDATLCFTVLIVQTALLKVRLAAEAEEAGRRPLIWAGLFWTALGWGVLLKGPVPPMVAFTTLALLFALERRASWWRRLHAEWGVPLMLLIALPWFIAIGMVSHGAFFQHSVGHNMLYKVTHGQQSHGFPPGYYFALFNLTFWPGTLFAALALPWVWRRRSELRVRFLIAWITPTWVIFELIATKLPHYVLPLYPAIACLAGAAAADGWELKRLGRWLASIYAVVWLAVGLLFAAAGALVVRSVDKRTDTLTLLVAGLAAALVLATLMFCLRRNPRRATATAGLAALMIFADAYGHALPSLRGLWLSAHIEAAVKAARPCPGTVLATASYREPSLVFLAGRDTKLLDPTGVADYLAADRACGLALIGANERPAFLNRLAIDGAAAAPVTEIDGRNYSTGKQVALTLYRAVPAATSAPPSLGAVR